MPITPSLQVDKSTVGSARVSEVSEGGCGAKKDFRILRDHAVNICDPTHRPSTPFALEVKRTKSRRCFAALFRADFRTFIGAFFVMLIVGFFTFGIGAMILGFCWAFMYNGYYTRSLLEQGYLLADTDETNRKAAAKLGVVLPTSGSVEHSEATGD